MARAHYHVNVGMRGYMPNATYDADTRKGAEAIARGEAAAFAEAFLCPMGDPVKQDDGRSFVRMVGSARSGWYEGPGELSYHYIQIVPCSDDCDPEEENW